MIMDAIIGILILSLLAGIMVDARRRAAIAQMQLSNTRAAERLAETRLTELQTGAPAPLPAGADASSVTIDLSDASPVASMHWVRVRATVAGRAQELVGLVPLSAPASPSRSVP
jgi:hypothetical protein